MSILRDDDDPRVFLLALVLLILALFLTALPARCQEIEDVVAEWQEPIELNLQYGQIVKLNNLTIACPGVNKTAIRITYPDAPSIILPTVVGHNIKVLNSCLIGLWCTNCWNGRVDLLSLWGNDQSPMIAGVILDGRSNDFVITGLHSTYTQVGVSVRDRVESLHLTDSAIINTIDGVVVETEHVVPERPGLHVTSTHIAASRRGISSWWHPQAAIIGNLIYKVGSDSSFVGIEIGHRSADSVITNNTIVCNGSGKAALQSTFNSRVSWSQLNASYCSSNGVSYFSTSDQTLRPTAR